MATEHRLKNPIYAHAFNGDNTMLAVSHKGNDVYLYEIPKGPGDKFKLLDKLSEHTSIITGIDWAPKSNKIVSCSADRNAYVWNKQKDGKWKPTLVALMLKRAAVSVRWSPMENKFAVTSANKCAAVCFFEEEHDWWVARHVRRPIRSTVSSIDWHPNNYLLALGGYDFKARVYSVHVKEVDGREKPAETAWGRKLTFGSMLFQGGGVNFGGWVHSVSFSACGNMLAWVSHDCTVRVADARYRRAVTDGSSEGEAGSEDTPVVVVCNTLHLPFLTCTWLSPTSLLCAGFDFTPIIYHVAGANSPGLSVSEGKTLVSTGGAAGSGGSGDQQSRSNSIQGKFRKFQNMVNEGVDVSGDVSDDSQQAIHENDIKEIRIMKGDKSSGAQVVTTAGLDGRLVMWDLRSLAQKMGDLKI